MIMITKKGATLEPMEELRKLTASLVTPTTRSKTAKSRRINTAIRNISVPIIGTLCNAKAWSILAWERPKRFEYVGYYEMLVLHSVIR
jgi:hypothetical protein